MLTAKEIARQTGLEVWDVYLKLDEILSQIADRADERLAWQ